MRRQRRAKYRAWATDVLTVLDGLDQMAAALKEARKHVPVHRVGTQMMIHAALAAAGAA